MNQATIYGEVTHINDRVDMRALEVRTPLEDGESASVPVVAWLVDVPSANHVNQGDYVTIEGHIRRRFTRGAALMSRTELVAKSVCIYPKENS